jgi:SAM-dependent methyltransferase
VPKKKRAFLPAYLQALPSIRGWLDADAALMFMAYNQVIAARGIAGDVLEIGVYHGKSAIALAAMRGPKGHLYAIDLFDALQSFDAGKAGVGMLAAFEYNLRTFFQDVGFLRVISGSSANVRPDDVGDRVSFCHVDGDHSAAGTYKDFELCCQVLRPGGLLAVDDYFNPLFPGVGEGAVRFALDHPDLLTPLAIGFNKVIFQKATPAFDANLEFAAAFPYIPKHATQLWDRPANLFLSGFGDFLDLSRSTPERFTPLSDLHLQAEIEPRQDELTTGPGEAVSLPVRVINRSSIDFTWGIALSYHLFDRDGELLQWDNGRAIFDPPLRPGEERLVELGIGGQPAAGRYRIELDLVWDNVCWFKDRGGAPALVDLAVA